MQAQTGFRGRGTTLSGNYCTDNCNQYTAWTHMQSSMFHIGPKAGIPKATKYDR